MRRQGATAEHLAIAPRVEATEAADKKISPAALPPQSMKRIRGSFDIYALEGKEEYIKLDLWPDLPQDSCGSTKDSIHGMYGPKEFHQTTAVSEISPVLATYDGQSRLFVADHSTQDLSETDNFNADSLMPDLSDDSRIGMLGDRCSTTEH
ncbi:hypothetical protein COEREDRAFT_79838, partial [Coemansia reversa NRRL 1564]